MVSARRRGSRVRVAIVDDHQTYVYALTALLEEDDRYEVVATACCASDALPLVLRWTPDLLLIDVLMPGGNGIDAVREICELHPLLTVLVLSGFDDTQLARRARAAGAAAFLSKTQPPEQLIDTIGTFALRRRQHASA